jgi:hypothetical protein
MNKKLAPLALGLLSFFALQAHAEIFKCKGKIAYQETPCLTTTVGKMGYVPDLPLEDQIRAQSRANEQKNMVRQIEATEEARRRQGEAARSQHAENQRQFALEQEAEKKRQEEKKAEAREKRRQKSMHCTYGSGVMNCF